MYAGKASLLQAVGKAGEMKKAQKEMEKYVNLLKETAGAQVPTQGGVPETAVTSRNNIRLERDVTLNYEFRQGVPVVKVVINGHTYYFLFDTCAGITCVSDKLVNTEKLAYQQTGNSMQGMDGQTRDTVATWSSTTGSVTKHCMPTWIKSWLKKAKKSNEGTSSDTWETPDYPRGLTCIMKYGKITNR